LGLRQNEKQMSVEYNTYKGKAYRFLTFEGLFRTLENKTLRFTRADKFNDPLDCSPYIAPIDWEKFIKEGGEIFGHFANDYIFSKVFKSLFVCCFCMKYKTKKSYLMWSHYGQKHSQVCFEIDFTTNKYLGRPSKVTYPDCLITEREKAKSYDESKLGLYLATNKLKQWSYEKEVRLLIDILKPDIDFSKLKLSDNNQFLFVDFDLKYISKIIFGVESELFNELKTRDFFLKHNLNPMYEKMYINPINLKLESKSYNFK
jgi:Protein of unknown function (DUF2971)